MTAKPLTAEQVEERNRQLDAEIQAILQELNARNWKVRREAGK